MRARFHFGRTTIIAVCAIITLMLLLLSRTGHAQDETFNLYSYGVKDGLTSNYVKSLVKGKHGFMWIGTDYGLARFNGSYFQPYGDSLYSRVVKHIARYGDTLYVVNDGGINRIVTSDRRSEVEDVIPSAKSPNDTSVFQPKMVFRDSRHRLWISEPMSIVQFDHGTLTRYEFNPDHHSLSFTRSFEVVQLSDGRILASSQTGGIFRYSEQEDRFIPVKISGAGITDIYDFHVLTEPGSGSKILLLAASTTGIYVIQMSDDLTSAVVSSHREYEMVRSIYDYNDDKVVIGTKGFGILTGHISENGRLITQRHISGEEIEALDVESIYYDEAAEQLWIGSDQGVILAEHRKFKGIPFPQSYTYTHDISIAKEQQRLLAVSNRTVYGFKTDQAPYQFKALYTYNGKGGIISTDISSTGGYWLGTSDPKLVHVERSSEQVYNLPLQNSNTTNHLFNLKEHSDGTVWMLFSNYNGVISLDPANNQIKTYTQYLPYAPLDILETNDGTIYIAGEDSLHHVSKLVTGRGEFEFLPTISGGYDIVQAVDTDNKGRIWALSSIGLSRFDSETEKWIHISELTGIRHGLFRSLYVYNENQVWIGTKQGIYRYDVQNDILSRFNLSDGIPDLINTYRTMEMDSNNQLWFGTNKGLGYTRIEPLAFQPTPRPRLSRIIINGVDTLQQFNEVITVSENSSIRIDFFATIYPAENVQYQHRFKGDKEWSELSNQSYTTFHNLPPGNHRVEVRALKRGGGISEAASMLISVEQLWYNSWWTYGIGILFGGAFLFVAIRYQLTVVKEARLRRDFEHTRSQLELLLSNIPVIIFVLNEDGLFRLIAGSGLHYSGKQTEDLLDTPYDHFFNDQMTEFIDEVRAQGHGKRTIALFQRNWEAVVTPVEGRDGEQSGVIGLLSDITDLMKYEKALIEAKEEAEHANKAKSAFLANMSHELRTPLNAILGFSQIMSNDNKLSGRHRNYVQITNRAGEHLLTMINDVLDLSKIESGKIELEQEPFSLSELLEDIQNMFLIQANNSGIDFEVEIERDESTDYLHGDEKKLRQILINLIGNAIKYTEDGSVLVQVDRNISDDDQVDVDILIKDTGVGIKPDDLKRIFDPFEQVDHDRATGTGLGLAITKRLTELMNGSIKVDSKVGEGTIFNLSFPFDRVDAEVVEHKQGDNNTVIERVEAEEHQRILVVDDVYENRTLITALLEEAGLTYSEAVNGQEAVEMCKEEKFELILMDIVMPVMDGRRARKEIMKIAGYEDVPVVAVTASGFENEREELVTREAFDDYIRKPFNNRELLQIIARLMNVEVVYRSSDTQMDGKESGRANRNARSEKKLTSADREWVSEAMTQMPEDLKRTILEAVELSDMDELSKIVVDESNDLPMSDEQKQMLSLIQKITKEQDYRSLLLLNEWFSNDF